MKINVTAFIFKKGKVLLTKRSKTEKNWSGWYVGPGGNVKNSDFSLKKAIRREVKEEVGLKIFDIEYITSIIKNEKLLFLYFKAKTKGKANPLNEVDKIIWLSLENLEKLSRIQPDNLKVLKELKNKNELF